MTTIDHPPTRRRRRDTTLIDTEQREDRHRVELTWVGNGAWRALDVTVPQNDARCLLAYLECRGDRVEVTWVRPFRPRSVFASLRDAYLAVNLSAEEASAG